MHGGSVSHAPTLSGPPEDEKEPYYNVRLPVHPALYVKRLLLEHARSNRTLLRLAGLGDLAPALAAYHTVGRVDDNNG